MWRAGSFYGVDETLLRRRHMRMANPSNPVLNKSRADGSGVVPTEVFAVPVNSRVIVSKISAPSSTLPFAKVTSPVPEKTRPQEEGVPGLPKSQPAFEIPPVT